MDAACYATWRDPKKTFPMSPIRKWKILLERNPASARKKFHVDAAFRSLVVQFANIPIASNEKTLLERIATSRQGKIDVSDSATFIAVVNFTTLSCCQPASCCPWNC